MTTPIAVVFGGRSVEHEVSVLTGLEVVEAMDPRRFTPVPVYIAQDGRWYAGDQLRNRAFYRTLNFDTVEEVTILPRPHTGGLLQLKKQDTVPVSCFFLALHGSHGEDGAIQGLLELAHMPYTGCDVTASALTMDKWLTKAVLRSHGLPVLPDQRVDRSAARSHFTQLVDQLLTFHPFPLIVKPAKLGSSVGVHRVENREALTAALAAVFRMDERAIVEPCIDNLLEINVSVFSHNASVVEIPIATNRTLTYEDKYLREDGTKVAHASMGMAGCSRVIDPTDLDPSIKAQVQQIALSAYHLLGCHGSARCDFLYDLSTSRLYFNELNAIPGSMAYYLWCRTTPRLLYPTLVHQMVDEALERHAERASLNRQVPPRLFPKF
jgi:D-alanine-D-alanine ligase